MPADTASQTAPPQAPKKGQRKGGDVLVKTNPADLRTCDLADKAETIVVTDDRKLPGSLEGTAYARNAHSLANSLL